MKSVFILFFLTSLISFGQLDVVHYGLDRGLPSNSVYGMCEDAEGRIWIGTDNGLAYLQDGNWKKYAANGLPGIVLRIYPAKDSGVYIVGNNPTGIYKLYANGNFSRLNNITTNVIYPGILDYDPLTETFFYSNWRNFFSINEKEEIRLTSLEKFHVRNVFISSSGIPVVSGKMGVFLWRNGEKEFIFNESVKYVSESTTGELILFAEKDIVFLKDGKVKKRILFDAISIENPTMVFESHEGSIWIWGDNAGLVRYKNDIFQNVFVLDFPYVQFTYLFEDSKKNIWCGTNGEGVLVIPYHEHIRNIGVSQGLKDGYVQNINIAQESAIVTTKSGIHQIFENDSIVMIGENFSPSKIKTVIQSEDGSFIFGTRDRYTKLKLVDSEKMLWASKLKWEGDWLVYGSWGFFGRIHKSELVPEKRIQFFDKNKPNNNWGRITGFEKVDSGYVVSAFEGTFFWDSETERANILPVTGHSSGHFLEIQRTSDSTLWMASGNYIYRWNGKAWCAIYQIDGMGNNAPITLKSKVLTGFFIDPYDRFWVGTESGLLVIVRDRVARFTTENGLISNSIRDLKFNSKDSMLWVGTNEGISRIDLKFPGLIEEFSYKPVIHSIEVFKGSSYRLDEAVNAPAEIDLSNAENSFRLIFSLSDYYGLSVPEYRYRVVGMGGEEWVYITDTQIDFMALSPGTYTVEIAVRTSGFFWSDLERIRIRIDHPFYQKAGFYIGVVMLAFLFFFWRLKKIKQKEREKRRVMEEMNRLELQALNAQMNPHFIFNSLNAVQHYLMPFKNKNAVEFIANLARLVRSNMQVLGKKRVTLAGELERIKLYVKLEQERYDKQLDVELHLNLQHKSDEIWIPPMVIQPLVENAIWHGIMPSENDGTIQIKIDENDGFLEFTVEDNGVGLAKAKSYPEGYVPKGVQLIRDRIQLYHAENTLTLQNRYGESGNVKGVSAYIKIKVVYTY